MSTKLIDNLILFLNDFILFFNRCIPTSYLIIKNFINLFDFMIEILNRSFLIPLLVFSDYKAELSYLLFSVSGFELYSYFLKHWLDRERNTIGEDLILFYLILQR